MEGLRIITGTANILSTRSHLVVVGRLPIAAPLHLGTTTNHTTQDIQRITTMIEGAVTTLLPTAVGGQPTPTPTTQATTTHHLPITPKTCTTAAETGRTKGSEEGVFQGTVKKVMRMCTEANTTTAAEVEVE